MRARSMAERRRGVMGYPSRELPDAEKAWEDACAAGECASGSGMRALYLHIPFCRSRCLFCPFYYGAATPGEQAEYVRLLCRELTDCAGRFPGAPINAVYFGGGTPTELTPAELEMLLQTVRRHYRLANDCEITLEGRLGSFDAERQAAALANGVNRFSFGVQTFDTELRRRLGRRSDRRELIGNLQRVVAANQASVVIDLLYGLPGQTMQMWLRDQETAICESGISGLDHYRLNVWEGSPLQAQIAAGRLPPLPGDDACFDMFRIGGEYLTAAGANRISIKHYAFSGRERNLYTDLSAGKCTCLPFGVRAAGRLGGMFFHQTGDLTGYRRAVERGCKPLARAGVLPPDYPVGAALIMQIVRERMVRPAEVLRLFPNFEPAARVLAACRTVLANWESRNLLCPIGADVWKLTELGAYRHKAIVPELLEAVAAAMGEK